jgi:hypothetical protein
MREGRERERENFKSKNTFEKITDAEIWNAENIYHLKTDISRISQVIYHYEIYKKIINIPGCIIECGVFKGNSLIRFLTYRSILENNFSRDVFGFDIFGKFPNSKNINDKNFIKKWEKEANNSISIEELENNLKEKKFTNFKLIKGNLLKTISKFLKQNPNIKIALLHLDLDTYEPTKYALNKFSKMMTKGGIILIDDYSTVYGATKAMDEFLKKNKKLKIHKLTFYKKPSFIITE